MPANRPQPIAPTESTTPQLGVTEQARAWLIMDLRAPFDRVNIPMVDELHWARQTAT